MSLLYIFAVQKLALAYGKLSAAYETVMNVQNSGRRLLGEYFRVAFFGQVSILVDKETVMQPRVLELNLDNINGPPHSKYSPQKGGMCWRWNQIHDLLHTWQKAIRPPATMGIPHCN